MFGGIYSDKHKVAKHVEWNTLDAWCGIFLSEMSSWCKKAWALLGHESASGKQIAQLCRENAILNILCNT